MQMSWKHFGIVWRERSVNLKKGTADDQDKFIGKIRYDCRIYFTLEIARND